MPGPLDGKRQCTLVLGAGSGKPAGNYFTPFGDKAPEQAFVFVIRIYKFSAKKT